MNRQKSENRINELIARFVVQVKGSTATSKTDINRISENVLIPLFSKIYGHTDLKKLDVSEGHNYPGIDLGDKETRTAYQVTSRRDVGKIKDTLEKFVAHKLYETYDHLIIYILREKRKYQGQGFDEIIQGKFCFDKENDIRDYRDLLREISGLDFDKVRRIEDILEQHFGEERGLKLDMDWFKTQFSKQMASVGKKFNSSLHTETRVDANLHALLGDEMFANQITELIQGSKKELPDLEKAINSIKRRISDEIEWEENNRVRVIKAAESLQQSLFNTINQFEQAIRLLKHKRLSEAQAIDWELVLSQLEDARVNYEAIGTEFGTSKIRYIGEKENSEHILNDATQIILRPGYVITSLLHYSFHTIVQWWDLITWSDLHIFGKAGVGKTHIAYNICNDRLKNGLPALFVCGSQFITGEPIEVQLRGLLGIPPARSWHEFLQALSAAAETHHTRIPLIIDGLNESTHDGAFSNVWKLDLKRFIHEISETSNVVLITTYRTSYKDAIWADENPLNIISAEGFDTYNIEQAVKKYFQAYKIVADPTVAQLIQFKIPIYLKIFCETINPNRDAEKHIYVDEWTLFKVFEKYLEQCNQAVCKRLDLEPEARVVQSELNKVAEYLWQHRCRYIHREDLACIIDGQPLQELKKSSSKMHALETEDLLLIFRDWVEGTEMMSFTYDLLGGYLIAQYLVQTAANHRQSYLRRAVLNTFGKERKNLHPFINNVKKCLADLLPTKIHGFLHNFLGHKTAHPLYDDIGRCLAAFLPSEIGKFLHEFSNNETVLRYSIHALFEIAPRDINENCVKLVTRRFEEHRQDREFLLKLAETTIGHPEHPFNASFWSERLLKLSMPERDLSWTEYVRRNRESFEEKLTRFEKDCRDDQDLSDISVKRLHLLAEHIMWVLTSTIRPLRDKATHALYWYGRRFPQKFFGLVMKSFTINDPYVSERMLAATYGIAMAWHNDFKSNSFITEVLPRYGRQLYETMFKSNALHATTHILARDYAKRIIDIALIHHPNLLTADEQKHITPPFTQGGIREWGESENRDEGPPPIQMDFDIYTLDRLIKYDSSDPNERKRVKANVYWRIYDLGFSLEDFREIDKWISEENWRYGRYNEDARKIDRYGKKYSWIAFYELAGFRQDNDLLPDRYDEGRFSGADIDPSFPDEQQAYNLITENFLGDPEISVEEWVSKTPPPDLTKYLRVNQICERQGPWILLQGFLPQKDEKVSRNMLAFLHGLIVRSEEASEIVEILKNQEKIDGHSIPSYPEDHRTYAGEIPWCDTYPLNKWEEFRFEIGKVLIPEQRQVLLRDGKSIPWKEEFEVRNIIADLIENEDEEGLETLLSEQSLEIRIKKVENEKRQYKEFEVLVPVRENYWEESCSAVIPHRTITLPAREIAEYLCLCGQPQTFDLFEKENGRRASITFRYGKGWGETQHFTYLRQDLLERYLAEIDGELIWVIWGNRHLVSQSAHTPYESFQEVKAYRDIKNED